MEVFLGESQARFLRLGVLECEKLPGLSLRSLFKPSSTQLQSLWWRVIAVL